MGNWYITPDIIEVQALENYELFLKFKNGEEKIYDMKEWIKNNKIYSKLHDKEYFKMVKPRKETIEWPDGEDVAPEYLYHDSIPIKNI